MLEVSNLRKSYGDRLLIDDLSFSIPKGAIVGIIGPNGAGKSTLFRMISGQEQPDSGTITLGETVKLASVDQFRDSMDNSKTVWEEVSGGLDIMKIGNTEMPSRAYVGRFNFKGVDQGKRVGELSGGERGRLHLAKLLQVGGNMLLLDEPTNDHGYRNPARAGKRPAGVPGLRDGYLARPLVPRPYRHAHSGLPG